MIRVRRLESNDLAIRVDWFNNPLVYKQMVIDVPLSLGGTQQWFAKAVLDQSRRDFSFIKDEEDSDKQIVAFGGLTSINLQHRHAELYIVVDPARTGEGIGGQCVKWICSFGFIQQNLEKVYLHTFDANDGARRLYGRLGFSTEGVLRNHIRYQGMFVHRHVQSLLKGEWEAQSWKVQPPLSLVIK